MGKKRVLLIAPDWMGLHNDIIEGLRRQNYLVDFIAEKRYLYDPFYSLSRRKHQKDEEEFLNEIEIYWRELLSLKQYSSIYDILFVVDGQALHPCVFSMLKKRNSRIFCANYLFDRIEGVYAFNRNFNYFDRIFTFDPHDAVVFRIPLLQIYWVESDTSVIGYDIFGYGAFSHYRYKVFKAVSEIVAELTNNYLIALYHKNIKFPILNDIKNVIRPICGLTKGVTSKQLKSGLITNKTIPTDEFRKIIASSNVVLDTSAPYQDGLTARFMWALGLGKKIITTNNVVNQYDFYSPDQVLMISPDSIVNRKDEIISFIKYECKTDSIRRNIINQYRIDNWLKTIIE